MEATTQKGGMLKDHEFYNQNGLYDYPQNNIKREIRNFILSIFNKRMNKKPNLNLSQIIIEPYKKLVEKV